MAVRPLFGQIKSCPRVNAAAVVLMVLVAAAGCGKKEDWRERYLELRKRHDEEIARLRSRHEKESAEYKREVGLYQAEVRSLKKKLDRVERMGAEAEPATRVRAEGAGSAVPPLPAPSEETAESLPSPSPGEADPWESFVEDYARLIGPERAAKFKKDWEEFLARRGEEPAEATAAQRRESYLDELYRRLDGTTDEGETEELQRRIETVQKADEEDLAGVLEYYGRLDDFQELRQLMEEYNISQGDLIARGLTPPPRDTWRPDAQETAYNLSRFVEYYEPLADAGSRERYRRDFQALIENITARPSDAEVFQRRDQMIGELEARAETAAEGEQAWLRRRIERLRNADADDLRSSVQAEKMRELGDLVEKYNIPTDELRQSGVLIFRGGGGRRPAGTTGWSRRQRSTTRSRTD